MLIYRCSFAAAIVFSMMASLPAADLSSQINAIRNVSREGQGNEAAAAAVRALSGAPAKDLVEFLAAF